MFFWIALVVVFAVFAVVVAWGARGIGGRAHRPRTQRLR
jgi:hypothetical protein